MVNSHETSVLLGVQDVTVRFGGLVALSSISLAVQRGETVGVIGPNGSGKTTLINVLTRLIGVNRGASMTFDSHNLSAMRPHQLSRAGMSRTFQSVEMCGSDSVLRSVTIGALQRSDYRPGQNGQRSGRESRADRDRRAFALLNEFGIGDWSGVRAKDVPYGVGKRAQICRALMCRPRLILLDEPASGMTATEKNELGAALSRARQDQSMAVVIIEHDVAFLASGLCDRLIALESGRLIANGTPDEVRADERVIAAYLGEDDRDTST